MELENINFEENLKKLENIVDELDKAELPLEELIKLFEEGINISKILKEKLDKAEQKIIDITK